MKKNCLMLIMIGIMCFNFAGCASKEAEVNSNYDVQEALDKYKEEKENNKSDKNDNETEEAQNNDDNKKKENNILSHDDDFEYDELEEDRKYNSNKLSEDLTYELEINGDVISLPISFSDMEKMGWSYNGNENEMISAQNYILSCEWEKDDAEFFTKITNFNSKETVCSECMITEISYQYDPKKDTNIVKLPGGFQLYKTSYYEILEAYGEPYDFTITDICAILEYAPDSYNIIKLIFDDNMILSSIKMECVEAPEDADTEISDERPEILDTYIEPENLSDDFLDTTFELDGVIYQLMCPLEKLLENGWRIDYEGCGYKEGEDLIIESGSFLDLSLLKDYTQINVCLYNPTPNTIYHKNSFVKSISLYTLYGDDTVSFSISDNLYIGAKITPDKIAECFDGMDVNVDTEFEYFQNVSASSKDGNIFYSIGFEDGVIDNISIYNDSYIY